MTYYHREVSEIQKNIYAKEYLCDQVVQAKKFIDENFSDPISLNDVACKAWLSKFHFLRLFKKLYGKTPHQYLTEVRIRKAKEFLSAGLPLNEVCFFSGFESISSFKGLFKRHTGYTPSSYRIQLKHKKHITDTAYRFVPVFFAFKKSNFQDSK